MSRRGASVQVGYEKPRWARTQSFLRLQAHWYTKLEATGFVDIEKGRDVNTEKAYRPDGSRGARLLHFDDDREAEYMMAENAMTFGTYTNVADTPTAAAWRAISRAAHELPRNYRHRLFLIDLAQVGCIAAYLLARHRLTWRDGNASFHRFLGEVGLDHFRGLLVAGPTRAPVGGILSDVQLEAERRIDASARALLRRRAISRADYDRFMGAAA